MSLESDGAAGSYVQQTSSLPAMDPSTIMLWFRLVTDLNAVGIIWFAADSGGHYLGLTVDTDGTSLRIISSAGNSSLGASLVAGNWNNLALVNNGTSHQLYINGTADASLSASLSFTPDYILYFSNGASGVAGAIDTLKIWSAALTVDEVVQEIFVKRPRRYGNLKVFCPCFTGAGERTRDYSGNGASISEAGAITDGAPSQIPFGGGSWTAPTVTRLQSVAGTTTTAGTIVKRDNKILVGTLSSGATLVRQVYHNLAATFSSSSNLIKQSTRAFAGTLTSAGALTNIKAVILNIAGTLGTSASLTKTFNKQLSASLTTTATIVRSTLKYLAATLTTAGAFSRIYNARLSLSATLAPASSIAKQIGKHSAGILSAGSNTKPQVNKVFTATLTSAGSFLVGAQTILLHITGTLGTTASVGKQIQKRLTSILSLIGSFIPHFTPVAEPATVQITLSDSVQTNITLSDTVKTVIQDDA